MDDSTNIMEGPTLSNGETPSSNTTGRKNPSPRVTKRAAFLAKDGLSKRVKTAKSQNARKKMLASSAKGTLGRHQQPNTSNPNLTLRALRDPVNTAEAKLQMVVRSEFEEQRESDSSHKVCSEQNSCHLPVKLTQTIKEETDMLENFKEETNEMEIKEETDELEIKEESLEGFSERWDEQLSDKCQEEEYECGWQVLPDDSDNDMPSGELERAEDSALPDDDGSEKKRKPPRNEEDNAVNSWGISTKVVSQETDLVRSLEANTIIVGPKDVTPMPCKGQLQQQRLVQRGQIIALHESGVSIRAISRRLGVSCTTVIKWTKRNVETGNMADLERRSRPRLTTQHDDEAIRRAVEDNPFMNAIAIREILQLDVSETTIRRRLNEVGVHQRVIAKKERLTDQQRGGRMAFAHQYGDKDLEFWSRVVFTDVKTFISTDNGRIQLRRPNKKRYEHGNVSEDSQSGLCSVNIWGWFSMHGMGDVVRIEGRFTAEKYLNILQDFFLPSLQDRNHPFPAGPIIFVQDRCPIRMDKAVHQWFQNRKDLQLLDWPSKSCDINPMENIWANIINCWEPKRERTAAELMAHTHEQWELFRNKEQLVRNHVSTMPDRLRTVIEKDGVWTRYYR